ncbi:MAG: signal recognition particle-docking protein FtsY [Acidimicrobiia bacterium]
MDTAAIIIIGVVVALALVALVVLARRSRPPSHSPSSSSGRLAKTSGALGVALRQAWGKGIDTSTWDEIEESLLAADVGVATTTAVVDGLRTAKVDTTDEVRDLLAVRLREELGGRHRDLRLESRPAVILVVGVNGAGKTTTIAKLSSRLKADGNVVLLGAGDTFRAAAGEQLEAWAERVGVDFVSGQEGGDPASVAFDAVSAAKARGADVVIIDTAGRLHGKANLMGELEKIHRVLSREATVDETLLVLDATAGQNGLTQVREFADAVPVSGIVMTKLDGTAKGGIIFAVERELGVPVKLVGLGEGIDDLVVFDPDAFVEELLEYS